MKSIKTFSSVSLVLLSISYSARMVAQKPNVIFILTDDQGYGDLACNGNPWIKTPNIDKLHSESVRFTNFHSGTTSAPTRAGLMTGKYCNKVGVWHTINGREILAAEEKTLAESMKTAGYSTGIFGKWHLGDNYPFRPQDRGFDEVLTFGGGGVGQQPDYWNNDYFDDTYLHNGKLEKFKGYCTDIWFDQTVQFIRKNTGKPFFCYISTNAPHAPFNVEDKYSILYKNNPNIPNPNFYGMISNIDENVGKLRDELERLGLADNTILIFMTDNGTSSGVKFGQNGKLVKGYNAGMRGTKGSPYDGGHRVPFFMHWPAGNLSTGKDITKIVSYIDFMPTVLDLCGITASSDLIVNGKSLKPLILEEDATWPERILFTDTQREEFLVKWKQSAAMTDRWRLVGKEELYDITSDPGQTKNVALQYPEITDRLRAAYELWWQDVSQNGEKYNCAKIGTPNENPVTLHSHDFHTEKGNPAFSQEMVRAGEGVNGFWAIEVMKAGTYEIELRRWPKESGLKLTEGAPKGSMVPGGKPYTQGKALNITQARIKIDQQDQSQNVESEALSVKFKVKLKAGKTTLQTWFKDDQGTERGAYYAYISKI